MLSLPPEPDETASGAEKARHAAPEGIPPAEKTSEANHFDIRLEFYQRVNYCHVIFMIIHLTLFFGIALFAAHRTRLWLERRANPKQ